jgi:hypothetical protein
MSNEDIKISIIADASQAIAEIKKIANISAQVSVSFKTAIDSMRADIARLSTTTSSGASSVSSSLSGMTSHLSAVSSHTRAISTVSHDSFSGMKHAIKDAALELVALEVGLKAIEKIGEGIFELFKNSLELRMDIDTTKNGIAGLVSDMYTIKDANGKILEGQDAFNKSVEISSEQVKKLQRDAIRLGLTTKELAETFKMAIAPSAGAGMNLDQARTMAGYASVVGKSLGMGQDQLMRDYKDVLIGRANTLSSALGLGHGSALHEEYLTAIKTGKAYEFLEKQFKAFALSGEAQANGLAGMFNALHDVFQMFEYEISNGLNGSLLKLKELLKSVYNIDTGEFTDSFRPIVALLNTIGKLLGDEIVNGVKSVISWVIKMGEYLDSDQSFINGMIALWNETKGFLGQVFGLIGDIIVIVLDLAHAILNDVNGGIDQGKDKISKMGTAMQIFTGFVAALKIVFSAIRDIVDDIVNALKVVIGGTIALTNKVAAVSDKALASTVQVFGKNSLGKSLEDRAQANEEAKQRGINLAASGKPLEQWTKTKEAALEGADDIKKAGEKVNADYKKAIDELIKKTDDYKKKKSSSDLIIPKHPNKTTGKAGKVSPQADADFALQKAQMESDLSLQRENAKQEQEVNDDLFKHNKITLEEYYAEKAKITTADFEAQIKIKEKEKAFAQSKKYDTTAEKTKNMAEVATLQGQINLLKLQETDAIKANTRALENEKDARSDNIALSQAKNKQADLDLKYSLEKLNQERLLSLHKISNEESLQMDLKTEEAKYTALKDTLNSKLALEKGNEKEELKINDEILAASREHAVKMGEIYNSIAVEANKDAQTITDGFKNSFATIIEDLESGKKSFKDSIKEMISSVTAMLNKMVAQKLAERLFGTVDGKTGSGAGIGGFFSDLINGKSSKSSTDTPATGGADLSTSIISKLSPMFDSISSMFSKFFSGLGDSFSSIFSSLGSMFSSSGGGSGGGMGSMVSSAASWIGSLASFDVGTNYVPNDQIAKIHKGEAIVPAKYNNPKYQQSGSVHSSINFIMNQAPDLRTQSQMATMAGAELQRAMKRNG